MIGIVIVANGHLAVELLSCLEDIMGEQEGMVAIATTDRDDRELKQEEICCAVNRVDAGSGVIVVTDIPGSSPANMSVKACGDSDRISISGANLPMLLKLVTCRKLELGLAAQLAADTGQRYIKIRT